MLLAFYKPYGVLSQFTADRPGRRALDEFGFPANVYPVGRLDLDSEGLLLLSDEPGLNTQLLDPTRSDAHPRQYWAQVEGVVTTAALERLARGVEVQGRTTRPARAWHLQRAPVLPPREPPIRFRAAIPTDWLALEIVEGRNRQARRMTAAVGLPTLRLIRVRIGSFDMWRDSGLAAPGDWRSLTTNERRKVFAAS